MTSQPMRLPTLPEELATFHAARSTLYRHLFELLRMPPRPCAFDAARRALDELAGAPPAAETLRQALGAFDEQAASRDYGQLFAPPQPKVAMRCKWPNCGVRDSAFSAADTLASSERVSELHVVSVLAERAACAFEAKRLPEAAAFSDVQAKLLSFHAGACLADLAEELKAAQTPVYAGIGAALALLVEQDLQQLGYSGA
ncbi:MAG: hypothetical protein ACOX6T_09810 [Myxococcales bacterium]